MKDVHQQIILLASIPIYAIAIPLEILLSHFHGWKRYTWRETLMNVYMNLLSAGFDLLLRAAALGLLIFFYVPHLAGELHPVLYWLLLFLLEDLLFWTEHFVDHKVRLFWAVHVTHHSSTEYNLTTGFRSSVLMPFYRYLYFIPLALLGFQPLDIIFIYAITQIYGILVHTQAIKKMPRWIEFIFVTPSHHRVHHASNVIYLDKNMGMALIIWDRLFGTFQKELESEPPVYGITRNPEHPSHPIHMVTHEWKDMGRDMKTAKNWKQKLRYLIMPPGWKHDGTGVTTKTLQEQDAGLRLKS